MKKCLNLSNCLVSKFNDFDPDEMLHKFLIFKDGLGEDKERGEKYSKRDMRIFQNINIPNTYLKNFNLKV